MPATNSVLTFGARGYENGKFGKHISGVVVAPSSGNIIVADKTNLRLQVFTSTGHFLTTISLLFSPACLTITKDEHIIVVNNNSNEKLAKIIFANDIWSITQRVHIPKSEAYVRSVVAHNDDIFVADYNDDIHVFNLNMQYYRTITSGFVNRLLHIAIDNDNNILVLNRFGQVITIAKDGSLVRKFSSEYTPMGLAIDPTCGDIVLSERSIGAIVIYSRTGRYIDHFYGVGNSGFGSPSALFLDHNRDLYVCDDGRSRMVVIKPMIPKFYQERVFWERMRLMAVNSHFCDIDIVREH
jgi:DNA-binding beta-propeller fold protein YncE